MSHFNPWPAGQLNDPQLFRYRCLIDGDWLGADSGVTIHMVDSATGASLGTVPKIGGRRDAPRHQRRGARCPGGGRRPARSARRCCAAGKSW
jgi:succinate-semialdehyde dehydrogenase/glutarate-semialdehyde dehydrogenase